MIEVIPGILEKNFDTIREKIELIKDYVQWVQIDILDNTLIKNDTYNNFAAFRVFANQIKLEAHLMVKHPAKYIQPLKTNGFDRLIAHVEAESIRDFIGQGRLEAVEIGVALDGPSKLELVEPYLGEVDCVLLMMYKAGFSGQTFDSSNLAKVRKIHEEYQDLPIEVDGGIDKNTAPLVIENGATRLVSTSYLFWKNAHRIKEAIEELKSG